MSAAALSLVVPALAIPLIAGPTALEVAGSLLAGLGAAIWVESRPARD